MKKDDTVGIGIIFCLADRKIERRKRVHPTSLVITQA
jgi:hypothetical protein